MFTTFDAITWATKRLNITNKTSTSLTYRYDMISFKNIRIKLLFASQTLIIKFLTEFEPLFFGKGTPRQCFQYTASGTSSPISLFPFFGSSVPFLLFPKHFRLGVLFEVILVLILLSVSFLIVFVFRRLGKFCFCRPPLSCLSIFTIVNSSFRGLIVGFNTIFAPISITIFEIFISMIFCYWFYFLARCTLLFHTMYYTLHTEFWQFGRMQKS